MLSTSKHDKQAQATIESGSMPAPRDNATVVAQLTQIFIESEGVSRAELLERHGFIEAELTYANLATARRAAMAAQERSVA